MAVQAQTARTSAARGSLLGIEHLSAGEINGILPQERVRPSREALALAVEELR